MARIPPLTHHRTPRRILRAKCQVVRERDFRLVADQVVDLSPTGALVMPADPVLTGETVIISFKLPHIPYWLDAEATVARVVHGRRPGEHTRGLALTFERLSGIDRYMIEQSLRYLPPAPPSFRAGRRENASILSHLVGSQTWTGTRSQPMRQSYGISP